MSYFLWCLNLGVYCPVFKYWIHLWFIINYFVLISSMKWDMFNKINKNKKVWFYFSAKRRQYTSIILTEVYTIQFVSLTSACQCKHFILIHCLALSTDLSHRIKRMLSFSSCSSSSMEQIQCTKKVLLFVDLVLLGALYFFHSHI